MRLLADAPLAALVDEPYDAMVLPGGMQGAECFQRSPLLVACVRRMHLDGKLVAAICAAPALVLQHHQLFSQANMTGFPALKDRIPADGGWISGWSMMRVIGSSPDKGRGRLWISLSKSLSYSPAGRARPR